MNVKQKIAIFTAILGNMIWGASFLFSKIALQYANPMVLLALRFTVAFLALNLVAVIGMMIGKFKFSLKGKKFVPLLALGVFQPIFALGLDAVTLRIYPTKGQIIFSIVSVLGVVIVSFQSYDGGNVSLLGILYLFGAVFSALCFSKLSQKASQEFSAFERTYFMFSIGFFFYMITALIQNRDSLELFITPFYHTDFVFSILYLGIISSVVAFGCMNFSLGVLSISQATLFNALATLVAIICGVLILNEPFGIIHFISSSMIIIGIIGFNKAALNKDIPKS